jgi:hypothetical protein
MIANSAEQGPFTKSKGKKKLKDLTWKPFLEQVFGIKHHAAPSTCPSDILHPAQKTKS